MLLSRRGGAELALVCYDGTNGYRQKPLASGYFAPVERHEAVLAGAGRLVLIRRDEEVTGPASFSFERRVVRAGCFLTQVDARESKVFEHIERHLVVLRLSRSDAGGGPVQEYRLSDGALLHQSSSDKFASCQEMAMAVLGRMGRGDAEPAMARIAQTGCDHLRWQALRHCLALDTAAGFRLVDGIARDHGDRLALPAGALRAQLVEAHPQLAALETEPCLAS